jgi:hypothetical protein
MNPLPRLDRGGTFGSDGLRQIVDAIAELQQYAIVQAHLPLQIQNQHIWAILPKDEGSGGSGSGSSGSSGGGEEGFDGYDADDLGEVTSTDLEAAELDIQVFSAACHEDSIILLTCHGSYAELYYHVVVEGSFYIHASASCNVAWVLFNKAGSGSGSSSGYQDLVAESAIQPTLTAVGDPPPTDDAGAVTFNGSNCLSAPATITGFPVGNDERTFSFNVNPDATAGSSGMMALFSYGTVAAGGMVNIYTLPNNGTGGSTPIIRCEPGGGPVLDTAESELMLGTTNTVSLHIVPDGAGTATWSLAINGGSTTTYPNMPTNTILTQPNIYVGADPNGASQMTGTISDLRISWAS